MLDGAAMGEAETLGLGPNLKAFGIILRGFLLVGPDIRKELHAEFHIASPRLNGLARPLRVMSGY